jgi:hypothetical protein
MADKTNFVLVPDPEPDKPSPQPVALLDRVRALVQAVTAMVPFGTPQSEPTQPPATRGAMRPRLIFGFDATASREPAWATARTVTDSLVRALPGELDVALAVHGGGALHTFTEFTANPAALRDHAAGITCRAGPTRLLPILSRALTTSDLRVIIYIGDVFEESPRRGQQIADALGARGTKLIVLHDTSDWNARRDAELFLDLARRTGGCVLPFDADAPARLRALLAAVAVYAVGGEELLEARRHDLPGATILLEHLGRGR